MGYQLTYTQHSGIDQQPLGMSSPAVAPYRSYGTADGQTVVLGTTNDREWQRLAREILRRNDLAHDERRNAILAGGLERSQFVSATMCFGNDSAGRGRLWPELSEGIRGR